MKKNANGDEKTIIRDFIRTIIDQDLERGKNQGRVHTRFPPEPNGYLHIGHAKSICLNFGIAAEYGGLCNLRFDDTNPIKEEEEYVESIKGDIRWLGFDWEDRLYFASDYFEKLYEYAVQLVKSGHAYVCDLSADEIRAYRGTLTEPGIYPTYDWAHGQSDSIEGITYSICTLEFEDHRPLYNWFLEQLGIHHPQQIEFARLNLSYTLMSKRKLLQLVEEGRVTGWNDPRMPTISGLRRRGYTPESIRNFCDRIGLAKRESTVDIALLEHCLREDLNKVAPRVMAVLRPLRVIIDNYPEGRVEMLDAENNPEDPSMGTRKIPFSRELYIEQDDFREDPPRKFFRLAPGREVRLKQAYYIKCEEVVKNPQTGEIVELCCTYDPETKGGWSKDGRMVRGTLHWVSAPQSIGAEIRLYDHLFSKENPAGEEEGGDWRTALNLKSLEILTSCRVEPSLAGAKPGDGFQFLRKGYFCLDSGDSSPEKLVFNRTAILRDTWAKIEKSQKKESS